MINYENKKNVQKNKKKQKQNAFQNLKFYFPYII